MRLYESFAELLWPTRCVGCELPGALLCERCRAKLPWIEQRFACPCCGAPFGRLTCTQCARDWLTRCCVCALSFTDVAAHMVTYLKDSHELRLAPVVAAAMACALDEASSWDAMDGKPRYDAESTDALVFVPATSEAYARRGFDHMQLVARELAPLMGLPLADVLVRSKGQDQRVLGRVARRRNLEGTVTVVGDVSGLGILLADDVVTTGSTLSACTEALLERGAESVTACTLARVW